jgi:hypothetical protein
MNTHFRPKIQNGPVAKRARSGYTAQSAPRSPKPSFAATATMTPLWSGVSASELTQRGLAALALDERLQSTAVIAKEKTASPSRVLLGLIGCGVLLTGGFMFSLRDHFTAHAMGREEVKLQSKIQQSEVEQQQLDISLQRVSSPSALDRAAREVAGLGPLEMERKKVVIAAKKVTAAEKAQTTPSAKSKAPKLAKLTEH